MIALQFALATWLFSITIAGMVMFTSTNYAGITVGEPFTITWTGATSDITLSLMDGPSTNLELVEVIASGLTGTSYIWTPETAIGNGGPYLFKISHDEDTNYSIQFDISGGLPAPPSSASPTTTPILSPSNSVASQTLTPLPTSSSQITIPPSTTSILTPIPPSSSTTSSSSTISPPIGTTSSFTEASSAPSPTSNVQPISDSGLGTGAKIGIGVGVVLGLAIIVFLVWLIFRRRRTQRVPGMQRDAENGGSELPEKGSEMMTPANTHEIDGKPAMNLQIIEVESEDTGEDENLDSQHISPTAPGVAEIDNNVSREAEELKSPHSQNLPELGSEENFIPKKAIPSEMPTQFNAHEIAAATNVGSDWEHLHPSELDSTAVDKLVPKPPVPIVPSEPVSSTPKKSREEEPIVESSTGAPVIASADTGQDELEILQKRIEQVRADKERLERIQQLKDLESELQRDILAAQKRKKGDASGSS